MISFDDVPKNLQNAIIIIDANLTVVSFNERLLELLERPRETIDIGMGIDTVFKFGDAADPIGTKSPAEWLDLLSDGANPSRLVLSTGQTIVLSSFELGSGGWILICDDVTQLLPPEDQLAERFDAALNNMPHGLCMFDAGKRLILCNSSYTKMYNLPPQLTRPGTLLNDILEYRSTIGNGPLDKATYFDLVIEANSTGATTSQNIPLRDGRVIKISHNPMGEGGYVATHENITETLRISDELRKHRDTLEITVKLRTEEIERQAKELERLLNQERNINELQRQFVTMASHEFRTPLTIIDAAAQRMLRRKAKMEPDFVEEKIDQIRTSVSRIVDLMESILSAGRLDNGVVDINYEACELKELIKTCCDRQAMIAKSHRFLLDLDRLPQLIAADRRSLEQVFTNLLSNAAKYSPAETEIRVSGWEEGGEVKISVTDSGVGIDAEDLPRMFQRYFRARTSTGIAGTGIGLNLVKQIVELHQGSIALKSQSGFGSTFTVTLPIRRRSDIAALPNHIDAA